MTQTIDDRLHNLNKELDEFLGVSEKTMSNMDYLVGFGYTKKEARSWLKQAGISPENLQGKKSPDKLTEPLLSFLTIKHVFYRLGTTQKDAVESFVARNSKAVLKKEQNANLLKHMP